MSDISDLKNSMRRSVAAAGWVAIGNYASFGLSFIIFLVLARLLSPAEFGIVAVAMVFLDIASVVARGGLPDAIVQRHELEEEYADTAFWTSVGAGLVFCFAFIALAHPIGLVFGMPELHGVLIALSFIFVTNGLGGIHEGRLQRAFGFKSISLRTVVANVLSGLIALWLAFAGYGIWSLVLQRLLASILILVITWIAFPWRPRFRFNGAFAKEQMAFGFRVSGSNLLMILVTRSYDLIAALLIGPTAVAYVRLSWRCIDVISQIVIFPLVSVSLPTYSRLQHDLAKMEKAYLHFVSLASTISLPCFIGLAAVSPLLIPLMFGEKWTSAADTLRILCFVSPTMISNVFMWPVLTARNRSEDSLRLNFIQLILGTVAALAAAPFGLNAMVASHVLSDLLLWPFQHELLRKRADISVRSTLIAMLRPSIASIVMVAVVVCITLTFKNGKPLPILLLSIVGGGIAYVAVLLQITPDRHEIVRSLMQMLRDRKAIEEK